MLLFGSSSCHFVNNVQLMALFKNRSRQWTVSSPEAANTLHMCIWQFQSSTLLEWQRFLFTFFNVSDQIWGEDDQIKMKLHSEYDYECIRNSLSTYPLLSQQAVVSNRSDMASSQSNQPMWLLYHQLIIYLFWIFLGWSTLTLLQIIASIFRKSICREFLTTWGYNSLGDLIRQHKVWRKILLNTNWADRSDVRHDILTLLIRNIK